MMRSREEIKELLKVDPFWVFRKVCPDLSNEELYSLYNIIGWKDEWEKSNADNFMTTYLLEKELE